MGFGELVGYDFRFLSGYLSDKTGKYWLFVIVGYIITERFGKAIRTSSREAMLSYATQEMGTCTIGKILEKL